MAWTSIGSLCRSPSGSQPLCQWQRKQDSICPTIPNVQMGALWQQRPEADQGQSEGAPSQGAFVRRIQQSSFIHPGSSSVSPAWGLPTAGASTSTFTEQAMARSASVAGNSSDSSELPALTLPDLPSQNHAVPPAAVTSHHPVP